MSDLIRISDLEVHASIGVPVEEREKPQRLLISLDLAIDCVAKAAITDDVTKTVNYYDVAQQVKALVVRKPRKLLETLAEEIASDLLGSYPIKHLTLEIKKFILPDTQYVSLKIERPKK
jgi:dihydroneopterin aldolase